MWCRVVTGQVTFLTVTSRGKALKKTQSIGLASSFLHPPPDPWWKGCCSLYDGSPTPIPLRALNMVVHIECGFIVQPIHITLMMMVQMSRSFFHFPSSHVPATDVRAGVEGLELLPPPGVSFWMKMMRWVADSNWLVWDPFCALTLSSDWKDIRCVRTICGCNGAVTANLSVSTEDMLLQKSYPDILICRLCWQLDARC